MYEYAKKIKEVVTNPGEDFLTINIDPFIEKYSNVGNTAQQKPTVPFYAFNDEITETLTESEASIQNAIDRIVGANMILPNTFNSEINMVKIMREILTTLSKSNKNCAIMYSLNPTYLELFRSLSVWGYTSVFHKLSGYMTIEKAHLDGNVMYGLLSFNLESTDHRDTLWTDQNETLSYMIVASGKTGIINTIIPYIIDRLNTAYVDYLTNLSDPGQYISADRISASMIKMTDILLKYYRAYMRDDPDSKCIQTADMNRILSSEHIGVIIDRLNSNYPLKTMSISKLGKYTRGYLAARIDKTNNQTTALMNKLNAIQRSDYSIWRDIIDNYPIFNIRALFRRLAYDQLNVDISCTDIIYMDGSFYDLFQYQRLIRDVALIKATDVINEKYQQVLHEKAEKKEKSKD